MTDTSKSNNIDFVEDFDAFIREEVALGVPASDLPDFDEFVRVRGLLSNKDEMLKFVSPNKLGNAIGTAAANPFIRRMVDAGVDAVSKEGQRVAANIADRLASGEPFVKVKSDFGDTGGSSGGSAGGSGSPGNPFMPNRINYNPKPVQVRLDTGILTKGYGDYYPVSKYGLNVLEMTQAEFRVPEAAGSELRSYFDTVITFNFQNDAQMRINFNVNAINNFSATNLRNWMNRYAQAYARYVWFTTIINYCNEPLQSNEGMRALRAMMTPQLLDDLSQLANMLDGTPAPPKFREFIHFIYGAPFKVSNNPGSQIRMICPLALSEVTVGAETFLGAIPASTIQASITNLFAMRETTALIARVCPHWIPGKDQTPGGASVCEFSPNWHTLWENLPYNVLHNGVASAGPPIGSEDADGTYGSMADTLDGAISGLWNGYDITSTDPNVFNRYRPGTIVPLPSLANGSYSNRVSYRYNPGTQTSDFRLVTEGTNQDNWMRNETYTITTNGATHEVIWPGREIVNNINIASARQTSYEFYSQMFDMGSVTNKSFNRDDKSSGRRRKSRAKSSSSDTMKED